MRRTWLITAALVLLMLTDLAATMAVALGENP